MQLAARLCLLLGALGVVLTAVACWVPDGGPWAVVVEPVMGLDEALRRAEALERTKVAPNRCGEAKRGVVADLLAGRLTLFEAAGQFRALDRELPMPQPLSLGA